MSYYSTTILGESPPPQAYWRMSIAAGTTVPDLTGNGYTGTLNGNVTLNQTGAISGDSDTSIAFAGASFFSFPSTLNPNTWPAFSLEFWIKQTGTWHHVVITADSTSVLTYLDGFISSGFSGDPILFGGSYQNFTYAGSSNSGTLDEIALYPSVLSPARILSHFLIGTALLNSGFACVYANGTGTASFDTLRVTQYPDPSASLANVGRAAYSNANWNALNPPNTEISVTTSLDNGLTYQPATNGNDIWGITTNLFATLALQKKPAGYYRLDDTGTSITDLSGNGNTGTAHGGVTVGQPGALQGPGEKSGTCMLFDGSTGFISLPSSLNPAGLTTVSVSCWINPTSISGFKRILANAYVGSSNTGMEVILFPNGTVLLNIGNGTTNSSAQTTSACVIGAWTFFCATFDGSTIRAYFNGILQATTSCTGAIASSSTALAIGYNPFYFGDYYSGFLDEVALYPSTLSAQDILGLYNAGLCGVGQIINDSFTDDTSASYFQTVTTGGSAASWTWDTTNSRMVAVGGNNALLLYKNIWAYDTDLLVDFYQSENGGIVWGYQDTSNYYLLQINDSAASISSNTMIVSKRSNGIATTLSNSAIAFPTQTHHRIHITMLSGAITTFFDGVPVLSYTDATPFAAGLAGLFHSSGTSSFYLFQQTPQAVDLSKLYLVTKQALVTSDPTATPQITDHQSFAGDKNFATGSTIPQADYRQTVISDNFDDLNTQSNYWWRINDGAMVEFKPQDADDAPFILQPSDILTGTMPSVEYSGALYRNQQVLTGVYDEGTFTEVKLGDGSAKTWNVANPIISTPSIQLNGADVAVGIQGTDTGKTFYYQANSNSITQDSNLTTLTTNDVIIITYQGTYNIDFSIDNTGGFPGTVKQQDMALIDGTSGIVTAVEDVSQKNMNKAAATTYGNQLLQRYGTIARTITFQTLHNGLQVGHSLPIFIPQLNIFDSVFLVVKIDIAARTISDGSTQYIYDVTASEAAALSSWQKLFGRVMSSVKGKAPKVKA